MNKIYCILFISLLSITCKGNSKENPEEVKKEKIVHNITTTDGKNMEIVFCLDATGSMSGLIGTAKEKIWDIVSELTQSNDVESLKLGMIFYRDKGEKFITKKIELTSDLDAVYSELLKVQAEGGGDSPESVNQALNEAITQIEWSKKSAYKTIFVVGDCPPHMDYQDDVKYTTSCKVAAEKGITINTIKLGMSCSDAIQHFKKMASCTNGQFLQLDQNATDVVITTPYDDEIYETSKSIDESKVYYGSEKEQAVSNSKKNNSLELYEKSSKTAIRARAAYSMSAASKTSLAEKELVDDYINDKVNIEEIVEEELPNQLKGKSKQEIKDALEKLKKERKENEIKMVELQKKKIDYIKEQKKTLSETEKKSFSEKVVEVLKTQSK